MFSFFALCLLAARGLTLPVEERSVVGHVLGGPSVEINDGTVKGSSLLGVESFKGIPYAQPPVGDLRLKKPLPINSSLGTIDATTLLPNACPQFYTQVHSGKLVSDVLGTVLNTPLVQEATNQHEDCLTVNVQRPTGVNSSSKLPVLFWIYGGGYNIGTTQFYDGSSIVKRSKRNGEPIVFVAVNYRLGAHGWLAGKELTADGHTNLGLRDQRLGLQWVADNIEAFGGDPEKVTIWGESAGSISVMGHTIINGGDNTYKGKPLFRAGIMNSGSILPAQSVTAPKAQAIYDTVAETAGCSGKDSLECLRKLDANAFLRASTSVPNFLGYHGLDLSYMPRPDPNDDFFPESPEIPLREGRFFKMPIIIGDQEDEGTLFSLAPYNISTNAELISYLAKQYKTNSSDTSAEYHVSKLLANYPDEPSRGQPEGSPYNALSINNIYPQFRRLAAVVGDLPFNLVRRVYLEEVASQMPSWSYLATYLHGTPIMGTFHASDILHSFGILPGLTLPTRTIQNYFLNFVNHMDPNKGTEKSYLVEWPQWESDERKLVEFGGLKNGLLNDTFRAEAGKYLSENLDAFRL